MWDIFLLTVGCFVGIIFAVYFHRSATKDLRRRINGLYTYLHALFPDKGITPNYGEHTGIFCDIKPINSKLTLYGKKICRKYLKK